MNRRELFQKVIYGGAVVLAAPAILESCTKSSASGGLTSEITLDLSQPQNAVLNSTGGSVNVQNVLVINTGSSFSALSSICTHQGCTVGYNASAGKIQCPCHGSQFSTAGSVLNGPAPAPLEVYQVSRTGNILTIRP